MALCPVSPPSLGLTGMARAITNLYTNTDGGLARWRSAIGTSIPCAWWSSPVPLRMARVFYDCMYSH